jgi:hypothetical protein
MSISTGVKTILGGSSAVDIGTLFQPTISQTIYTKQISSVASLVINKWYTLSYTSDTGSPTHFTVDKNGYYLITVTNVLNSKGCSVVCYLGSIITSTNAGASWSATNTQYNSNIVISNTSIYGLVSTVSTDGNYGNYGVPATYSGYVYLTGSTPYYTYVMFSQLPVASDNNGGSGSTFIYQTITIAYMGSPT